jgi:1,4-alpha-glucan branching enzyme
VRDLNACYRKHAVFWEADATSRGFEWLECSDPANGVLAFLRRDHAGQPGLLAVFNFTPVVRESYPLGVPQGGAWRELLNTDADCYGGGNVGNQGRVTTSAVPSHGRDHSLRLTVPPLGAVYLVPET